MTAKARITRRQWYALGGFANPSLYRRQRGGTWQYWAIVNC